MAQYELALRPGLTRIDVFNTTLPYMTFPHLLKVGQNFDKFDLKFDAHVGYLNIEPHLRLFAFARIIKDFIAIFFVCRLGWSARLLPQRLGLCATCDGHHFWNYNQFSRIVRH